MATPPQVEQLFAQARGLLQSQPLQAATLLETILKTDREHLGALQYLAMIHLNHGKADRAERLLRQACRRSPDTAELWNNLGLTLQSLGRQNEAVAQFRKAAALKANYAIAFNNMGNAYAALQRHRDAITAFDEALAMKPNYVEAITNRGVALRALGQDGEAVKAFQRAVATRPAFAPAHLNLARALAATHQLADAISHYKQFLSAVPRVAEIWIELADTSGIAGRQAMAITAYKRAMDLAPSNVEVQEKLAMALEEAGRIDEARSLMRALIHEAPGRLSNYLNLVRCEKLKADDPVLAKLGATDRSDLELNTDDRIYLHFALGKALADAGEPESSFIHYMKGNALKRSQITFDEAKRLGVFEHVKRVFTPQFMQHLQGFGCPNAAPIFILGMPRSGSTLVEQILSSHPKVIGLGERREFRDAVRNAAGARSYPEFLADSQPAKLQLLGEDYISRITRALALACEVEPLVFPERVTDKMPANFRYVGLIHLALPNARIIHTRREPVDTCLSCFTQLFAENHQPFTYELGELGRYYRAYDKLMKHWDRVLPPGIMLEVNYRDLVEDFESQSRRLINHCGLDWNPTCLEFHKTNRSVKTASSIQVRQPLYRSSIQRWRPSELLLRPLLEGLEGKFVTQAPQQDRACQS